MKKVFLFFTFVLCIGVAAAYLNSVLPHGLSFVKTENRSLDVRIFFGYKDSRPARFVADRYEKAIFVKLLTSPCSGTRQDCEFEKLENDPGESSETLSKTIRTHRESEGGHFDTVTFVQIRVFASSVGADDNENRRNPYQKWHSQFIENEFIKSLQEADIVFYNGHSRAGGGPDFFPPRLTRTRHVNYSHYQRAANGLALITRTLRESPASRVKFIGLYSCQSDQLFRQKIQDAGKEVEVRGSRQLLYFSDALNDSLDMLSKLMTSST